MAAPKYPQIIASVRILSDIGHSKDPYSQRVKVAEENGLNLMAGEVMVTDQKVRGFGSSVAHYSFKY